jgi:hypothetical protein
MAQLIAEEQSQVQAQAQAHAQAGARTIAIHPEQVA